MLVKSTPFLFIYSSVLFFIIGTVAGSFLNCYAGRYVAHIPITKGRSVCDSCNTELKALDLIPILSWIMSKGKCRHCRAKVSIRYPLTELFCGIMSLLILYKYDLSLETLVYFVLFCCLFALSLVDLDIYEIPDACIIIPIIFWVILNFFKKEWLSGILGGLLIAGSVLLISLIMDKILKKESMGGGDIKLLFVTGLYLGIIGNLFCLIISCFMGIIFVIGLKKDKIPFGPSIAMACMFMVLYGGRLVELYLSLF
ncbi:MAG: prepilin peptidase [Erysipelotrichaceae bacterium]|nr:prepilin peptidase [Erysipelotrichaceae bacterium]